jgi:hypothetical protein
MSAINSAYGAGEVISETWRHGRRMSDSDPKTDIGSYEDCLAADVAANRQSNNAKSL